LAIAFLTSLIAAAIEVMWKSMAEHVEDPPP
jgi:hypothetical protein